MFFLNTLNLSSLKGDLYGGLTAAIVSLPLALTFGVASGVGPEAGLYGAIIIGFFAALFGGTPTLISEPTGPMTVVMTAVVTNLVAQHPDNGIAMAFTVVMIAGVFQILIGALKLGNYITLMPYSVVSGFMSGVGVILIILQLAPLLGQPIPPGGVMGVLHAFPELARQVNPNEALLGLMTLLLLFFMPKKLKKYIPAQLTALIIITLMSIFLFEHADIQRIGQISISLPSLQLPHFTPEQITSMLVDGIVLGTLGCIDSLLTAVISDSLTRVEHKPNKELIGQGIGNLLSGILGGLPGAGATMGTIVNIQCGARTAVSGLIRALSLVVFVLGASHLLKHIPLAVLAGIAIKVGVDILDWSFVKRAHKASKHAALIMYGVMLLTIFVDLIVAVGLGVFIANILTIEKLSALQAKNVKAISDADDDISLSKQEKALLDSAEGRVLLIYLSGPMIFGVAKVISRQQHSELPYESVVLDLSSVPLIDVSVSLAIENAIKESIALGRTVYIVKPTKQAHRSLDRLGVFELMSGTQLCQTRLEALQKAVH